MRQQRRPRIILEENKLLQVLGIHSGVSEGPKHGDNSFEPGTSFETIKDMADIDSKMRSLLMEQIAVVEVALRSAIAHEYGRAYGENAFYLDPNFYIENSGRCASRSSSIIDKMLTDLKLDKSGMVSRYVSDRTKPTAERYENVPIWVAVEVASFGRISNMITYAKDPKPAKDAAATFNLQWNPFVSTVHALSVLRNQCAHHRQLWNRRMDIQCPVQKKLRPNNVSFDSKSAFCHLIMLNHYRLKIDGDKSTAKKILQLLDDNPLYSEGFRNPQPK